MQRWLVLAAAVSAVVVGACHDDPGPVPIISELRVLDTLPAVLAAGEPFSIRVELVGEDSARATRARNSVELAASPATPVEGQTSVRGVRGIATFSGVVFARVDSGVRLRFSSGHLSVETAPLRIIPGPASAARSSVTPYPASVPRNDPVVAEFTFRDARGNAIAGAPITLGSAPGAVVFSPAGGQTSPGGTFTTTYRIAGANPVSLTATVAGTAVTFSPPIATCAIGTIALPGTANGTLTPNTCVARARATAAHRFTTGVVAGAAFSVTSAFAPVLEVSTDPVNDNYTRSPAQGASSEWLLPPGTYQVRVSSGNSGGTYSISGATNAGNSGCVKRALVTGAVYTGQQLNASDCQFSEDLSFFDAFVIYSTRPCSFSVISNAFAPWLFIYDHVTDRFVDGRGGGDAGIEERVGYAACNVVGHPLEVRVNADPGFGGTYLFTVTVTAPATIASARSAPRVNRVLERAAASESPAPFLTLTEQRAFARRQSKR